MLFGEEFSKLLIHQLIQSNPINPREKGSWNPTIREKRQPYLLCDLTCEEQVIMGVKHPLAVAENTLKALRSKFLYPIMGAAEFRLNS